METTTLQIPLPKSLKSNATAVAKEYGFSSLQEIVRVLLAKLSRRELSIHIHEEEYIKLSPSAQRRYKQMMQDFKAGKNTFKVKSIDGLMRHLRS